MKEVQYIKINKEGSKFYYKNKEMTIYHRTDGPAIEWADGAKGWYINGKVHRTDGPAYEGVNGYKAWYVDGELTEEQFKAKMQPKININGKDFTVDELNALIGAAKGK